MRFVAWWIIALLFVLANLPDDAASPSSPEKKSEQSDIIFYEADTDDPL